MQQVPLIVTLAYTAFMAVLLPVYLYRYGPTNFLYFCDLALLLTLVGLWLDSPLLISMCAVGIVIPQLVWVADFLVRLLRLPATGMTDYMFETERPLFLRLLSLFHGWLPFLLLYLVWRMGYDPRALAAWTVLSCIVLPICYFFTPPPHPAPGLTPVNINFAWGFSDRARQTWVSPQVWFVGLLVGLPLFVYWPTHLFLSHVMPPAPGY